MSVNVGNISARFGLDPSEFLERLRGVSGATQFFSDEMKRQMRETSREGTESFRLIDEALGIHLSRPLTKLITQEFPGFAGALQSVLGGAAVGAIAAAGFEVFEKISRSIEKAEKAQQELRTATYNTAAVFAEEISAYKEKDKAITAATEKVNKLIEAQLKQTKATEDASGWWTHMLAAIGEFADKAISFEDTLGRKLINSELSSFQKKYDKAGLADEINKTHTAADLLTRSIKEAHAEYDALLTQHDAGHSALAPGSGISWETVSAAHDYLGYLKEIKSVQDIISAGERAKEAEERQKKVTESTAAFYREIGGASSKIAPDVDPIHKLEAEITQARIKAVEDFDAMREAGASALNLDHALEALGRLEAAQDRALANAKAAADVAAAQAKLPSTIAPTGQAPTFATPNVIPSLGAGGTAEAHFSAFAGDRTAQLQRQAEAYELAMTAQDKYNLGVRELDLLFQEGLINQNAYKAAIGQLDQQLVKAADSTHKLQEEVQKLLERSTDAAAGLKAFGDQLQIDGSENAKFTYDLLTSATKSGEDDAIKSLFLVLDENRGGHRQLIADLEHMWAGYFRNLASQMLKFQMDKLLAPLGKALAPPTEDQAKYAGTTSPASASSSTSIWTKIMGGAAPKNAGAGGTSFEALSRAGTLLQASANALQKSASALQSAAQSLSSSGSGGGAGAFAGGGDDGGGFGSFGDMTELAGAIPYFASGGDATPGSSFISGEAGAEQVDLDGRGGAHITPLGASAVQGDIHNHFDMRGSIVSDDVMRRTEAAAAIKASESRMMTAMPAMQREISLRKRS